MKRIAVLGAGGHGRVIAGLIRACATQGQALSFAGFIDRPDVQGPDWLGADDDLHRLVRDGLVTHGVVGVGSVRGGSPLRATLYDRMLAAGVEAVSLVHPFAWADPEAEIGTGSVLMAGAVVNPGVRLGRNVIVNTRAGIDHDAVIGDHAHIAPGATLSGQVSVGDSALVGVGASVRQGIRIGHGATVGAGAVVVHDVSDGAIVAGCPARPVMQTPR